MGRWCEAHGWGLARRLASCTGFAFPEHPSISSPVYQPLTLPFFALAPQPNPTVPIYPLPPHRKVLVNPSTTRSAKPLDCILDRLRPDRAAASDLQDRSVSTKSRGDGDGYLLPGAPRAPATTTPSRRRGRTAMDIHRGRAAAGADDSRRHGCRGRAYTAAQGCQLHLAGRYDA
jgi:hypothetical protein